MTTYTLTGSVIYSTSSGAILDVGANAVSLEIIVPDAKTTFKHVLLPPENGNPIGEAVVDFGDYNVRVDGKTISATFSPIGVIFGDVSWNVGGTPGTATILDLIFFAVTVGGLGVVDAEYIFNFGGDTLPITDAASYATFQDNITGLVPATGTFTPGADIPYSLIGAAVSENDRIVGTAVDDDFSGGLGRDRILGMGGDDTIRGLAGNDTLLGGAGNDKLFGGASRDKLNGQNGNDQLTGGAGNDVLTGGKGRDILDGGKGNDTMSGGAKRDTFIFNAGNDVIKAFNNDRLKLDDALWANKNLSKAKILEFAEVTGSDTLFDFGGGNTLLIEDYTDIGGLASVLVVV